MTPISIMKVAGLALCAALLPAGSNAAFAASFDCAKAKAPSEKAICTDAGLAELDVYLSRYYAAALDGVKDGASCVKTDQRKWVKKVRNACGKDVACLKGAHLARLATLHAIQPGASALKAIELPSAPQLVVAIPPEAERLAGDPAGTFEARGQLVYEMEDINNMGLAVRDKAGPHAFVFEISLGNSESHAAVQSLIASEPQSRFLVRGTLGPEGGFADGDCRFVYRVAE